MVLPCYDESRTPSARHGEQSVTWRSHIPACRRCTVKARAQSHIFCIINRVSLCKIYGFKGLYARYLGIRIHKPLYIYIILWYGFGKSENNRGEIIFRNNMLYNTSNTTHIIVSWSIFCRIIRLQACGPIMRFGEICTCVHIVTPNTSYRSRSCDYRIGEIPLADFSTSRFPCTQTNNYRWERKINLANLQTM